MIITQQNQFDMFRLTKSKAAVDVCANTIRSYFKAGLPCYRHGRAVFVSKQELQEFIRNPAAFAKQSARRAVSKHSVANAQN